MTTQPLNAAGGNRAGIACWRTAAPAAKDGMK